MNTIFALYYADGYYGDDDPSSNYKPTRGLDFPGRAEPDYWDFLYFSFVVGMIFQVSDVQIEDHSLRRSALAMGCWLSSSTSSLWLLPSIPSPGSFEFKSVLTAAPIRTGGLKAQNLYICLLSCAQAYLAALRSRASVR
jgi:Protein of unknown function (DUF1345)